MQAVPAHRARPTAEWSVFHRCAVHKNTNALEEIYTACVRQQVQKGGRGEGKRRTILDIFMSRNFTQASAALI